MLTGSFVSVYSVRSPGPAASQQPSQSEQELAEVKGHLRVAEEQNTELAEQLKNANATVEQYRAVVLTLEDSLKKEKEVKIFCQLEFEALCPEKIMSHIKRTLFAPLVPLPSGGPAEGDGGGAAAAREKDYRGGENKAAGARGEEESYRCSGETSKLYKCYKAEKLR